MLKMFKLVRDDDIGSDILLNIDLLAWVVPCCDKLRDNKLLSSVECGYAGQNNGFHVYGSLKDFLK